MVFDKQGHFINGLTQNDFQLKVDGKIKPIQAFELIKAGSNEEAQLAAARGTTVNTDLSKPNRPIPLDRGRTIFFYLDDFHLDVAGFVAAKKAISSFIEKQMGQNDQIAITTATGQIGFLQQLTNNKTVLQEAVERLKPRTYSVRDAYRPSMREYEAILIDNNDPEIFDFFVVETMRLNPGMTREGASSLVRARAQAVVAQSAVLNTNTLSGLEKWVRSVSSLPGRKVVFLLSNGFFVDNRRSDTSIRMRQIVAAAAKSGVVIYSMDTRGLVADVMDLSGDRAFDPTGRLQRATHGELFATQDGLNALAKDTGGRAIFNTNDFNAGLATAVKETSVYYLLAWKPDSDGQKPGRFRNIEVSIVSRSDLSVRVRRGFFDIDPATTTNKAEENKLEPSKTTPAKLRESIIALYPVRALPIAVNAVYYDVINKGPTISASVHLPGEFMVFGPQDGKIQAVLDMTGVFYNDRGVPVKTFQERLVTTAPDAEAAKAYHHDILYTYPTTIAPGLYQVRVAARDEKSGRVGSAHSWVNVPDLAQKQLATSSLLVGERTQSTMTNVSDANELTPISLSATHRFNNQSALRFLIFAYNAAISPTDAKPDVAVQVQVLRDDQPVITTALRKVSTAGVHDITRLPYAAEIPLDDLTAGQYVLHVAVIDKVSKKSVSQQTRFEVY
ncbi:MAG TPA: VWA domain-containing protein, partial [Pyrinomonadaceae bacterium]